jgi:hypothetical protein
VHRHQRRVDLRGMAGAAARRSGDLDMEGQRGTVAARRRWAKRPAVRPVEVAWEMEIVGVA